MRSLVPPGISFLRTKKIAWPGYILSPVFVFFLNNTLYLLRIKSASGIKESRFKTFLLYVLLFSCAYRYPGGVLDLDICCILFSGSIFNYVIPAIPKRFISYSKRIFFLIFFSIFLFFSLFYSPFFLLLPFLVSLHYRIISGKFSSLGFPSSCPRTLVCTINPP